MAIKSDKLMLLGLAGAAIIILIFATNENSLVLLFYNQYTPIDWDEVLERNIVRTSIPIELISEEKGNCIVTAKNFDGIIDHEYFIRSGELADKLNYDRNEETLLLPCNMLAGDKSRLEVTFIVEESEKHSKKYEYDITIWEGIPSARDEP